MTRATTWFEAARNRFWVVPALAIVAAMAAGIAIPGVDDELSLPSELPFTAGAETARSTLQLITTLAVSVAGISFSVIVVALVLASQQLSPRVLRSFQRHPLNQAALAIFLATAVFSLFALNAVEDGGDKAPEISVAVAMVLAVASLTTFVFFLHHAVRSLNASAVIRRIAADGHQAVHHPYPAGAGDDPADHQAAEREARVRMDRCTSTEVHAPRAGYVISVEAADLVDAAEKADGFVEQETVIGDFVVTGAVLARIWCASGDRAGLVERVNKGFILNEERVVDDDVAFPLRQLTDVALKGLSPGVNDPTTAENAMDSVTDTLVRLARQPATSTLRVSGSGTPRMRTRRLEFDALVRLGFDQVRRDGARRPSFAVRLLELLADLRALGGEVAASSPEVRRQARLTCEGAVELADVDDDAAYIHEAYRRLHGDGAVVDAAAAFRVPASRRSP